MADKVTYDELKKLLANSQNLILIDVRSKEEVDQGCIPRSFNIPLETVEAAFKMGPEEFKAKYGVSKPTTDAPELVLYCRSGRRSGTALETIQKLGYVKARNYAGSWLEWAEKENL